MAAVRSNIALVDTREPARASTVSGFDRRHHTRRARAELDAAYRAAGSRAAAAHLSLFLLHLEEARLNPASGAPVGTLAKDAEVDWMERSQPLHRYSLDRPSLDHREA